MVIFYEELLSNKVKILSKKKNKKK